MDNKTMLQEFGERLLKSRTERGYSQRELSDLAGLSCAMITKYEKGNTDPGATNLIKIARVLNVDPAWLMAWSNEPASPDYIASTLQTEFEKYGVVKPGEPVSRDLLNAAMPVAKAIAESLRKLRND